MNTHTSLALLVSLPACQAMTHEGKGIGVVFMHGRDAGNPTGGDGELERSMERYGAPCL